MNYIWGSNAHTLIVTEGDSWPGFYAAHEAYKSNKFKKVIAAVQDKSNELSQRLESTGVTIREYDVTSKHSLRSSLKDADVLLVVPARNEKLVANTKNVFDAAKAEESIHTVLLWSSLGVAEVGDDDDLFGEFKEIEELLQKAKFENEAIFRLGFIAQQLFALSYVVQNKGVLPLPIKNGKVAPVNSKDAAIASINVLADKNKFKSINRQTLTLTGPSLYSGQLMVHAANNALQSRIKYKEISLDEYKELLQNAGQATELEVEWSVRWFKYIKEDKLEVVTKDLEKLLGRPPRDLEQFFAENARAFKPGNGVMSTLALREHGY